jgi:hypothetical protein
MISSTADSHPLDPYVNLYMTDVKVYIIALQGSGSFAL